MNKNFAPILFFYCVSFLLFLSSETWFTKWMVLELNTLCFVGVLMWEKKHLMVDSATVYFLTQALSSLLMLMAVSWNILYKSTSSLLLLFLIAILMKLALAPMHLWFVGMANQSPWKNLFLLMTAQKLLPLLLLEKSNSNLSIMLMFFCISSVIYGSMSNFSSPSMKKILIFSSLSNMGWLTAALMCSGSMWKTYFLIYILTISFILLSLNKGKKEKNLNDFFAFLSIGGIPPFMGFFPKISILLFNFNIQNNTMMMTFISMAIVDLFIYTRLMTTSVMQPNFPSKWQKSKDMSIFFVMANLLMIGLMSA